MRRTDKKGFDRGIPITEGDPIPGPTGTRSRASRTEFPPMRRPAVLIGHQSRGRRRVMRGIAGVLNQPQMALDVGDPAQRCGQALVFDWRTWRKMRSSTISSACWCSIRPAELEELAGDRRRLARPKGGRRRRPAARRPIGLAQPSPCACALGARRGNSSRVSTGPRRVARRRSVD